MWTLLALTLVLASGCLDANRRTALRYDERTDTFYALRIYYNIKADDANDVSYLEALYRYRDSLLLYDPIALFDESAALRLPAGGLQPLTLGARGHRQPPLELDADFKLVTVQPGTFFLSPQKTLCYYHQMTAPGKFVDQLVALGSTRLRAAVLAQLDRETMRRQNGGVPDSWTQVRERLQAAVSTPPPSTAPVTQPVEPSPPASAPATNVATTEPEDTALRVLREESLTLLRKGIVDKSLTLSRKGSELSLLFRLTSRDADDLKRTSDFLRQCLRDQIGREKDPARHHQLASELKLAEALHITVFAGKVTAWVDVMTIAELWDDAAAGPDAVNGWEPPNAGQGEQYRLVVRELKSQTSDQVHLGELLPAFRKGRLAEAPAATTATAPATQPDYADLFLPREGEAK
jgi:hypothetical protein